MSETASSIETIANSAGTKLSLHFLPGGNLHGPVVLSHGTFSNHRSCRGLATHLAGKGFDCWVVDSQGHGLSEKPALQPDFETMYLQDTQAALAFISHRYPGQKLKWVSHSGGGLAILMYLARYPDEQNKLDAIVTLASQATDAGVLLHHRLAIRVARFLTALLPVAPGKLLKIGPENEFPEVMLQWYDWSLSHQWKGRDGFDYLQALPRIHIPALTLAAKGDRFIAPSSGCEKLHSLLSSVDKTYQLCGMEEGFGEDYSHARIVSSRQASRDVWPLISDWLLSRQRG